MNIEEIQKLIEKKNGYINVNNYQIIECNQDKVIMQAKVTETSLNPYKLAHGGFIFGLGDTAMGVLAAINCGKAVTMNATINYLKPVTDSEITAVAEIVKNGNKICYLKANIYNKDEKIVATMDSNYYHIN